MEKFETINSAGDLVTGSGVKAESGQPQHLVNDFQARSEDVF